MMLFAAAVAAPEAGAHGGAFHPVLPWLILALPLLGFVLNGALALVAARRALPALPPVGDPHWDAAHDSEAEGHADAHAAHEAHAHDAHASHDDHAPAGPKPFTHTLPSWIAPGVMVAAFVLAMVNFLAMQGAGTFDPVPLWRWMDVPGAGEDLDLLLGVDLLLDPLSMLMVLIITGVGSLIHLFSVGYMKEDPGYPRYMAYLNLFVFFMLVLVTGASFPVMFVGWEGVGLCSYLLIGFWFKERANADAGKKAFIVNRVGDFGFLLAMCLIWVHLGTLDFQRVAAAAAAPGTGLAFGGAVVTAICLFLLLGAAGKSAQIPLYVWLPDAMAGPTPVSALIHAATMVTAGVYLVARNAVLFTMAPTASLTVGVVGALTAIFAATVGLKQWDIKKVLAYSTVSQLGFMFAAVGMGAYVAGVFHLMTHAFFKACLFLGSGAVIHAMHHALHHTHNPADAQDMRNMGGLRKYLPVTFGTMAVATLAIAGVPPFSGFFSKDEIIGAAWLGAEGASPFSGGSLLGISGNVWMGFIGGTLTIAAAMTAFYMGRMMLYTFFGENRTGEAERKHLHEGNWTLTVPLVALAVLSAFGGFLNVESETPIVRNMNWLGFGEGLHHWLHPVLAPAEAVVAANLGELPHPHHAAWPILLAIAIGVGGLAAAWLLLSRKRLETAEREPAYTGAAERVLYHKWYIDELYDRVVVRPTGALARAFSGFDRLVVDGLVDFLGRAAQWLGLGFGRLQTGRVNTYAFVLVVGVLGVLIGLLTRIG